MNRNEIQNYMDDIDDESMILVGSRFLDAIQRQSKRPLGRMRDERDPMKSQRRDHKPIPYRDRSF